MDNIFKILMMNYPELGKLGQEINKNIYEHPHTAIIKARIYAEHLIDVIIASCNQKQEQLQTYQERIIFLQEHQEIDKKIYVILDKIRRLGNIAAHGIVDDETGDALKIHRYLFTLNCWFIEMYIDQTFQHPDYSTPKPQVQIDEHVIAAIIEQMKTTNQQSDKVLNHQTHSKKDPNGKNILSPTDVIPEGKYAGKIVQDIHKEHPFYFAEWFSRNKKYYVDLDELHAIYTPTPEQCEKHKENQKKGKTILTLDDEFPTGKYRGQLIRTIHEKHPDYIAKWFNTGSHYYVELD